MVEIELWAIGGSHPAPKFNVVERPMSGHKDIDSAHIFEERLDLKAVTFDAKKVSGVRFYKDGCKIKGNQNAWPGYIKQQLNWALAMRQVIAELGL